MDSDEMEEPSVVLPQRERISQRLSRLGIPRSHLSELRPNVTSLVKKHETLLHDVVSAILPSDSDVSETQHFLSRLFHERSLSSICSDVFGESSLWLQWLMFGVDPESMLTNLTQKSAGQRRVCGAVWGQRDLAYRCRTCEHDLTCAICVSCFKNGNHEGHDYSIMYTGGGCCDCGDITAWKREGFCSKHKGSDHIQPLSEEIATSVGPVLDALFRCWKERLLSASSDADNPRDRYANEVSSMIVKMLLEFCNCCEGLLSFVSERILEVAGLLELLMRTEMFLSRPVVKKLHELLLKLLGEPTFKEEFAKFFVHYYPVPVNKAITENSNSTVETYTLLSFFSVQIFTVPTLTPRLVMEENLLGILFECLWNIFQSCADEDGCLKVYKWANISRTTIHLVEEIRYVMSHEEVPKYVVCKRPDVIRYWFRILELIHGFDPQKRGTRLHSGDENEFEFLQEPFIFARSLWKVQKNLIDGAFSVGSDEKIEDMRNSDVGDHLRHAKVGRLSQERSFVCSRSNFPSELVATALPFIPFHARSLIFMCMKYLDALLAADASKNHWLDSSGESYCDISNFRAKLFQVKKEASRGRARRSPYLSISYPRVTGEQSTGYEHGMDDVIDADVETFTVLNLTEWPEIIYDVNSLEISFHIPIHRLLGFLLQEGMKRCYGKGGIRQRKNDIIKDSGDFFWHSLGGFHPSGFSSFVMEHPLRLRVFYAQVRAGMWRRNSDTGTLLSEFYHAVYFFEIGVEPDLFLLQCCAALAPPEMFIKRIVERFNLLDYLSLNALKGNEYEVILLKEMLTLIIQIITQRRFCGLSTAENLRREIVHKLSTGDATRSQLVECLPADLSEDPLVQDVIDTVAMYSNPSGLEQGRYSLKASYWKELDLYHPRWRPRDLQRAEERFLRFCKSSAIYSQLPRWSHVFDPLLSLSRIATSKTVLFIIRAVLFYAVLSNPTSVRHAPDGVLLTSLHLLSLALDVCEKCPFIGGRDAESSDSSSSGEVHPILRYAHEKINGENQSMISLLVSLMWKYKEENNHNFEDSRSCDISSLIECLINKFAQLDFICMVELKRLAPDVVREKDSEKKFLRSASDIDRKAKAREHQAAILAKMRAQQSKFATSLKSTENDELDLLKSEQLESKNSHIQEDSTLICSLCREADSKNPLCILIHLQKSRLSSFVEKGTPSWDESGVIGKDHTRKGKSRTGFTVDSRNHELDLPSQLFQLIQSVANDLTEDHAFTDTSNWPESVLNLENKRYLSIQADILHDVDKSTVHSPGPSFLMDVSSSSLPSKSGKFERFGPIDSDGIHISSCGHAVHRNCHDLYLFSLRRRHEGRLGVEGLNIVDPEMGELLCPVCRRLANSILPILPKPNSSPLPSYGSYNTTPLELAISLLRNTAKNARRTINEISSRRLDTAAESALDPILRKLCGMYYINGYDHLIAASSSHLSVSLILWDLLKYSLTATEIASRGRTAEKSDGSLSGLEALFGEVKSSNGFILSLLLQIAQASKNLNRFQVLVRFSGIMLLESSICSNMEGQKGSFSSIVERLREEEIFPDIKFLKQASDPILAHDPCSSLMWVLFCLPLPFLSSPESFTALVNLFYVVCVIQALITCHNKKSDFKISKTGDIFPVDDLCRSMRGSDLARIFFVSNYFDSSSDPRQMIRRLTFPYLRKCTLLWNMLTSSTLTSPRYEKSAPSLSVDFENPETLVLELEEISELETRFQIPPLEEILRDGIVFSLASKWCAHFSEFGPDEVEFALYSTPAVPFRLLRLPRLYQDLLQRYVKQRCSECNNIPEIPALCLFCGRLCSAGWKQCCRASKCQNHAAVCGAGIGVFLLIKRTTVLLQRSARQASWPSLYLDSFGEEDHDMKRGRPLHLSDERYTDLSYLVATHGFDCSSAVLRFTTTNHIFH